MSDNKAKIKRAIEKAEESDAYFITITRQAGGKLFHQQFHTLDFHYKDLIKSLGEIYNLLEKEYPGFKYGASISNNTGAMRDVLPKNH